MKTSALTRLVLVLTLVGAGVPALAQDIELYMDSETKQIYAEPGPNRKRMGKFRPVDETASAASPATAAAVPATTAAAPTSAGAPASAPAAASTSAGTSAVADTSAAAGTSSGGAASSAPRQDDSSRSPFTNRFQIRGYVQNRYTEMLGGDDGINLWSDRSVGDENSLGDADKNFLIRRARLIFQGDVGDRLSFYVQPDLASSAGTTGNVAQMRDAYGDVYLTTNRVHRLRVGQSKVPYGWENLQSSSNRLALDRADALNSAVRDERDLGVFYYFTPKEVQTRFNEINTLGLKHSGNYGMFGFGVYNGQGANRGDRNDELHMVARLSYPWKLAKGQFFEAGIQAYSGKYVPTIGAYRAPGDVSRTPTIDSEHLFGYDDERVGVSAIWYPQPFGLQAEWNWGRSPSLDLATNSIVEESLQGGYVQAMYKFDSEVGTFLPFVRWQYYDGANKAETNAPFNNVDDIEIGLEWQIASSVELAAIYHRMKRNNLVTGNREGRLDYERFEAEALRLQLQLNF